MFLIEIPVKSIQTYAMFCVNSRFHICILDFRHTRGTSCPWVTSVCNEGKEEANRLFPLSAP